MCCALKIGTGKRCGVLYVWSEAVAKDCGAFHSLVLRDAEILRPYIMALNVQGLRESCGVGRHCVAGRLTSTSTYSASFTHTFIYMMIKASSELRSN